MSLTGAIDMKTQKQSQNAAAKAREKLLPSTPAPLSSSANAMQDLFKPLAGRSQQALKIEERRRDEGQEDMTKNVHDYLKRWVQQCLVSDDKKEKLLEKGMLKCRIQGQWSEGLHTKMKALISSYGGQLGAEGEKENSGKVASWLARNEKWIVGFDAPAFEAFIKAHPDVIDPQESKVRAFAEQFVQQVLNTAPLTKLKDFLEQPEFLLALDKKFGPTRTQTKNHARELANDAFAVAKEKQKNKNKGQSAMAFAAGRACCRMETAADVLWGASVLLPWGLKPNGEPVLRSPWAVAGTVLQSLKALEKLPDLKQLLKDTQIGKTVNIFRQHPDEDCARAAKELITSWKTACQDPGAKRPAAGGEPDAKRQRSAA